MDKVLVLGASGSTGRLLVKILLQNNIKVIAIVRYLNSLAHLTDSYFDLQIVEALEYMERSNASHQ